MIEAKLGKHGIICMEDLVHEIYSVGPHFKQANKFLWTFKLNSPKVRMVRFFEDALLWLMSSGRMQGGFKRKLIHFQEGGDAGNREDRISALIHRMN